VQVFVNGEGREVPEGTSVSELLVAVSAPSAGIAVEVNQALVRRADLAARCLNEGDRVEIVGLVGGG
jgi:sulfur carrier protein